MNADIEQPWSTTCIHHTDKQREHAAGRCPVCLMHDRDRARMALEAVLLFHSGSNWDDDKRLKWTNLIVELLGTFDAPPDATTRILCNAVRSALGQPLDYK